MRAVVQRLRQAGAHHSGAGDDDVEAREMRHLDQRGDAAALGADQVRAGIAEFDFGRRVRAVADLVLEALDVKRVARAVGQRARHEEAGHPVVETREGEEAVAHRRRAEPLVAGQQEGPAVAPRDRAVGTQVRAALLLGHRHADGGAGFLSDRQRARVVGVGRQLRFPLRGERRRVAQYLHASEGHGDRAGNALLALVPQVVERSACGEGALRRFAVQASECRPAPKARPISSWYAGWKSTASMRWPKRSCVLSTGPWRLAWSASSCMRSEPTSSPSAIGLGSRSSRACARFAAAASTAVAAPGVVARERRRLVGDFVRGVGRGGHQRG